jgi:hypothetical protein
VTNASPANEGGTRKTVAAPPEGIRADTAAARSTASGAEYLDMNGLTGAEANQFLMPVAMPLAIFRRNVLLESRRTSRRFEMKPPSTSAAGMFDQFRT